MLGEASPPRWAGQGSFVDCLFSAGRGRNAAEKGSYVDSKQRIHPTMWVGTSINRRQRATVPLS